MTPESRPDEPAPQDPLPKRPVSNRAIHVALFLVIAVTISLLLWRTTSKKRNAENLRLAALNLLQISNLMRVIDEEYGRFPDKAIAMDMEQITGTRLTLGDSSSNQLFRQLLLYSANSEVLFWANTPRTPKKPDNIIDSDTTALAPGECIYSYVAGRSSADTGAPVIMTPLIPGTTRFDPKPFGRRAVVFFVGENVRSFPIEPDGRVLVNGRDLFDPAQPYWRGKAPDLKWPE